MKTIPLTVMVREGPMARAYLGVMRLLGMRPERILLLVFSHDQGSGKPVARWLPPGFRRTVAARHQDARLNHWVRRLRKEHPDITSMVMGTIARRFNLPVSVFDEMTALADYSQYADEVRVVFVAGLRDKALATELADLGRATILFTGGGMVPPSLFDVPGLRFIHVHPGYLPHVRGSDGVLWSTLVRGRPGASCFFMVPGLDLGDIVDRREFEPLSFDLGAHDRPDDMTLYRMVFASYDPMLRARMLGDVLLSNDGDIAAAQARAQESEAGGTYHFMHRALRGEALARIFTVD